MRAKHGQAFVILTSLTNQMARNHEVQTEEMCSELAP